MTIEGRVRLAWISSSCCVIDRPIAGIGEFSAITAANNRGFTVALTLVDESAADRVWEAWDKGKIDDVTAWWLWLIVAVAS